MNAREKCQLTQNTMMVLLIEPHTKTAMSECNLSGPKGAQITSFSRTGKTNGLFAHKKKQKRQEATNPLHESTEWNAKMSTLSAE